MTDEIFLKAFGGVARENGDELDTLINDNLYLDAERSRRWTVALCRFATEGNPGNAAALRRRLDRWAPVGRAMAKAGARLLAAYSKRSGPEEIEAPVEAEWSRLLRDAGLEE
jgi:toluene monooxygenase system protein E